MCWGAVIYSIRVKGSTEVLQASKEEGDKFSLDNAPVPIGFVTALKTMKLNEKASLILQPKCEFRPRPHDRRPSQGSGLSRFSATFCISEA